MRDVVDDFGFVGNTTTNNDAAFAALQAAIDAGLKGIIYFPYNRSTAGVAVATGVYKTTLANPLVIKNDDTRIVFEPGARIRWEPATAGTCIKFENPSSHIERVGLQDVYINAPNNIGAELVGVHVHDARYSRFIGLTTQGFRGATSTGLMIAGRDRLLFEDLNLAAERPLRLALNDREPTSAGKDVDHSVVLSANLIAATPPNPALYVDPGFVLRNSGLIEIAFAQGGISWVDGGTVPRRESNNFYIIGARVEQLADGGPVTPALFAFDIQKHGAALLTDLTLDNVMLAASSGNDWSGLRATGVSRTTLRNSVYRGGGAAVAGNGTIQAIQCSLEGL